MGGQDRALRATRWSLVLAARSAEGDAYRGHLEELIRTYWKPVFGYVRRKWGKSNEDSKDVTQAFFADLLERPFLSGVAPEKGRFRTFLLTCLQNFVHKRHAAEQAIKRGGGRAPVSLEFISPDAVGSDVPDAATPEEAYARMWEQEVVAAAVRRLREAYEGEGRKLYFSLFQAYDLETDGEVSYAELAERFGISATDVTNHLHHARTRFRGVVRSVVRDSLDEDADLPDELQFLFGKE